MKRMILLSMLLLISPLALSEELTEKKKQIIDEMLEITGALKIGEMMGTTVANQMIAAMSQQQKDIDPKIISIVQDEMAKIMHDEFVANGFVNEMSYKIYHKYFSTAELEEMLAFYKTPIGNKMATLMPQVAQEGMLAGQQHGQSLGPVIQARLRARFEKEGIK